MKRWYKSKTVWFNIAVTLVAIGNELMPLVSVMDGEASADLRMYLILATSFGNMILRMVTSTKVTL